MAHNKTMKKRQQLTNSCKSFKYQNFSSLTSKYHNNVFLLLTLWPLSTTCNKFITYSTFLNVFFTHDVSIQMNFTWNFHLKNVCKVYFAIPYPIGIDTSNEEIHYHMKFKWNLCKGSSQVNCMEKCSCKA